MIRTIIQWGVGLLLLLVILNNCNYSKNVKLLLAGKLKSNGFIQEIPFEYRKDLIVIKAQLNEDTAFYEFIFDTGAFNSKVESRLAQKLQLPTVTKKSNSTAQGITREIEVTRIRRLAIGGVTFENIGAGKVVYDERSASPCIAADGIIGANLIKLANWKIDYQKQVLYCSDRPFELPDQHQLRSFDFERPLLSGTPKIDLKVEEKIVENILFDIGYNGGLILPSSYAAVFKPPSTSMLIDKSTSGIYGTNLDTLRTKQLRVQLGGFDAILPVSFSTLNKALLGNDFLEHFIVYLDYEKKRIHLQAVDTVKMAEELSFIPSILSDSLWRVSRVSLNSPIQLGDTLQRINGLHPVAVFQDHCDYVHGIRGFLSVDTLKLEFLNGEVREIVH